MTRALHLLRRAAAFPCRGFWIPLLLVACCAVGAPALAADPADLLPLDLLGVGGAYGVELRVEPGADAPGAPAPSGVAAVPLLGPLLGQQDGGLPPEVRQALLDASQARARRDEAPQSPALLLRRARDDEPRLAAVLRAFGYFQGRVRALVESPAEGGASPGVAGRPLVVFSVRPGPRFVLGAVEIRVRTPDGAGPAVAPGDIGLAPGRPYRADEVQAAGSALIGLLGEGGRPRAALEGLDLTADHATREVRAVYRADAGPRAVFGALRLRAGGEAGADAAPEVDEGYLRGLVPWREGEPYRASLVERGREALFATGLFSRVEADTSGPLDAGRLDVEFVLTPRLERTVRLGADFTSDFGPGGSVRWEHRNVLGAGERLSATLRADKLRRGAELEFRKPRVLDRDQDLVTRLDATSERSDAYTNSATDVSTVLDRRFGDGLGASAGVGYRYSHQRDPILDSTDATGFIYLPLTARLDTRDAVLDPTRGFALSVGAAPFQDTLGGGTRLWRLRGAGSAAFSPWRRLTLGLRGAWGSIQGAAFADVPADLRLYAGGGGSVRGYGYQLAGETEGNTPLGGRSLLECSAEARLRLEDSWGLVAFVDGGSAYRDPVPDLDGPFFWGAGLGLRYFTAFGPLRLDVAVPMNRRQGVDDAFQVYAGIGQAF
ncbi:BamA/TamA family outer membrane protein [Desulfocurvus sp.]|jgi:translocation and assembly module TamA|uniref:autotransporter assembly complex protein TamA n=1 Tax=Desulfocurvus sp. TaxID=2871698 RepID=UPI0025C20199|nr:BamA/TamA family outer membrane protein [Desulfocurvus sp.]MCK9239448.1 BamA/TamA family outer membrane protein [Desulfocurvus sp.]